MYRKSNVGITTGAGNSLCKSRDHNALPEGKEENTFDADELERRVVRREVVVKCQVEEHKVVESVRDRCVLDKSDVGVTTVKNKPSRFRNVRSNC